MWLCGTRLVGWRLGEQKEVWPWSSIPWSLRGDRARPRGLARRPRGRSLGGGRTCTGTAAVAAARRRGGTERDHAIVVAFADEITGRTSATQGNRGSRTARRSARAGFKLTSAAPTTVDDADERSWAVLLATARSMGAAAPLGRQTCSMPVEWKRGAPVRAGGRAGARRWRPTGHGSSRRHRAGRLHWWSTTRPGARPARARVQFAVPPARRGGEVGAGRHGADRGADRRPRRRRVAFLGARQPSARSRGGAVRGRARGARVRGGPHARGCAPDVHRARGERLATARGVAARRRR